MLLWVSAMLVRKYHGHGDFLLLWANWGAPQCHTKYYCIICKTFIWFTLFIDFLSDCLYWGELPPVLLSNNPIMFQLLTLLAVEFFFCWGNFSKKVWALKPDSLFTCTNNRPNSNFQLTVVFLIDLPSLSLPIPATLNFQANYLNEGNCDPKLY